MLNIRSTHEMAPSRMAIYSAVACLFGMGAAGVHAGSATWTGGSLTDGKWSDGGNWSTSSAPGSTAVVNNTDVATFNAPIANGWGSTAADPVNIDSTSRNIGSIIFNGNTGSYFLGTLGGNPILLSSTSGTSVGLSNSGTGTPVITVDAPVVLEPASNTSAGTFIFTSLNSSAGALDFAGNISGGVTTAGITLSLNGTNTDPNTISGSIGNGGAGQNLALFRSSSTNISVWILSGSNTYSGPTNISEGTLVLDNSNALVNTTGVTETKGSSALELEGNISIGNIPLTVYGTDVSLGALQNISGNNSYGGLVTLNGTGGAKIASNTGTLVLSNTGTITSLATQFLNLGGNSSLIVDSSIGAGVNTIQKVGTGVVTLNNTNSYAGGTNVNTGTLVIANSLGLPLGTSLTVSSGATLVLPSQAALNQAVSVNLSGNLIVHGGSLTQLNTAVGTGFNSGAWNGAGGILSAAAAANTTYLTSLAVIQNDDGTGSATPLYTTFEGQPVADSDVLLKYTYYGDTDLNGEVDGSDYSRVDIGFLNKLTGWFNGDFNYDNVVNGSDYTLIDNAFNTQGLQISAQLAATTAQIATLPSVAVPEPSCAVLFWGAYQLSRRRRKVMA